MTAAPQGADSTSQPKRFVHCNLADAIKTHEVALAALQCYDTNRPVSLPLL